MSAAVYVGPRVSGAQARDLCRHERAARDARTGARRVPDRTTPPVPYAGPGWLGGREGVVSGVRLSAFETAQMGTCGVRVYAGPQE